MTHKIRHWIILTLCLLIIIGTYGAWVTFGVRTFEIRKDVVSMQGSLDATIGDVTYGETVRSLLRDTEEERAAIEKYSSISAVDAVAAVRSVADDAGVDVSINTIAPSTIVVGEFKKVPALTMSISSRGSFRDVYNFLQLLERAPIPLNVVSTSFEHTKVSTKPWTLRLRISVYTELHQK